ncbi:MAG: hypothetical protein Q8P36_00165 [bacterium]|nr:hypothetical protein [bacterium]
MMLTMKTPDLDRARSERRVTLAEFLRSYNTGLPEQFPRASLPLLRAYKLQYPAQFKEDGLWSLDIHRKKVMDWLPMHLKSLAV